MYLLKVTKSERDWKELNSNPQAYFKYLESGVDGTVKVVYKSGNGVVHKITLKDIFIADSLSKKLTREYDIDNSTISNCIQFIEVEVMKKVYKKLQDLVLIFQHVYTALMVVWYWSQNLRRLDTHQIHSLM